MRPIYLDYNATTPVDQEVAEAMLSYLTEHFGNPSSAHLYGRITHQAIDHARSQLAALLGCQPSEIVFTSGGTESNNTVIKGVAEAYRDKGNHIITSAIEHPSILESCAYLTQRGYRVTVLPVDEYGRIAPEAVEQAITSETILISVMLANNEVGTLQPIHEMAEIAHQWGALMHTDAVQAVGKLPVKVDELGVDFLSLGGHKFYAPKGVGALYVRDGVALPKFMHGASHEANRRAGTENVLGIVGMGKAAEIALRDLNNNRAHMQTLRDRLWKGLQSKVDHLRRNGHPEHGLPNTLSVSFLGVKGNELLDHIGDRVAASAGAACHADSVEISAVLQAMHVPPEFAMGTLRLSVGKMSTADEIDAAIEVIAQAVTDLRSRH